MLRSRLMLAGQPALWPTWDPATLETGNTLSTDNLTVSGGLNVYTGAKATTAIPPVGKWYWEVQAHNAASELLVCSGMVNSAYVKNAGGDQVPDTLVALVYYNHNWTDTSRSNKGMEFYNGTSPVCALPLLTTNPPTTYLMRFAFDAGARKFWFGDDHGWIDPTGGLTGNPSTGANAMVSNVSTLPWYPYAGTYADPGYGANMATVNFGASSFTYTPPVGFATLLGSNLYFP
jgi:hypothetical protein